MPIVLPFMQREQARTLVPGSGVTPDTGSPLWWVYRLTNKINREIVGTVEQQTDGVLVQRVGLGKLQRYYDGEHDLPWVGDREVRQEFLKMLERSRSNFMRIVANVPAERLVVQGLRLPNDAESADDESWDIWLRSSLDFWAPAAFKAAFIQRRAFLSVWYADGARNRARIAVEPADECIVEYEPGDRSRRAAGLKQFTDEWTGRTHARLFTPSRTHRFEWRRAEGGPHFGWYEIENPQPNPLGVVPLVPLVNQPSTHRDGVSELEDVLPVQDRINQTLFNRQVAEHLSAFRQKWATGLDIPVDPDTGETIQPFKAALESLWISGDPATKFGQFDSVDLANYHQTIEQDLEHLSVLSRTPRHVFMHQGQAPSGDAMKSDEAGLVAKVKGAQRAFEPAIREALTLARRIEGFETPMMSEVVWGDPEWQTFAQLVDGHVKMLQAGISSLPYARENLGMSPATMRRVESEVMMADLFRMVDDETESAPVPAESDG